MSYTYSKNPDQTAQKCSLVLVFTVCYRFLKNQTTDMNRENLIRMPRSAARSELLLSAYGMKSLVS